MTVRPSGEAASSGQPDPARDPRFLGYIGSAALADVGDQAWIVVLAYAAAQSGDPLTATLTVAAGTVPRAVLDLVGGAVADRLPTKPLLVGAAGARVLVLVLGLLALLSVPQHTIAIMVGVAVFFGAADALHKPAIGTMPRQLVPREQLVRAVGYRQLVNRLALLAGPALAGLVLGAFALTGAFGGLIAIFAAAALLLSLVRTRYRRELSGQQSVISSTREVMRYLRLDAPARALMLTTVGLNFFVTPVINAGLALRVAEQGWGPHALGLLTAMIGVGAIAGTVLSLRMKPTYPMRTALILLIVQGAGLACAGLFGLVGAGIGMAIAGLTAGLSSPLLGGTAQAIVQESFLGRFYAMASFADDALLPFALIAYGAVAGSIGVRTTTVLCGIGMAVLMAAGLLRRPLRTLRLDAHGRPVGEAAHAAEPGRHANPGPPLGTDESDRSAAEGRQRPTADAVRESDDNGPEPAGSGGAARRAGLPADPPTGRSAAPKRALGTSPLARRVRESSPVGQPSVPRQ